MRTLQPWLIINNRCGLEGDYDTPEQRLGNFQLDRPWETCMTLGTQWSWKPADELKSPKKCIDSLVTCVCRGGNLALNASPMPDGRMEPRQIERFREIGDWLKENGESIYGTRGGPFWGFNCLSSRKDNTIYVHVLKWYDDVLVLPPISKKIVSNRVFGGGKAQIEQTNKAISIRVPTEHRNELDTIIALELDGPATDIEPKRADWGALTLNRPITVSYEHDSGDPSWGLRPSLAVDGDSHTGWTAGPYVKSACLQVDLEEEATFDRAMIDEHGNRVTSFELQVVKDGKWKTYYSGKKIGRGCEIRFPPVTGRHVRLNIIYATANPRIGEFQIFAKRREP
jgi:alpha-L-fucosidase